MEESSSEERLCANGQATISACRCILLIGWINQRRHAGLNFYDFYIFNLYFSFVFLLFFLLQIVLRKLQDLQLAIVIVRLCERDYEEQGNLLRKLLCREIFGAEITDVKDFDVTPRANRYVFTGLYI